MERKTELLMEKINGLYARWHEDASKNTKAAQARARVTSIDLRKQLKAWREASIEETRRG